MWWYILEAVEVWTKLKCIENPWKTWKFSMGREYTRENLWKTKDIKGFNKYVQGKKKCVHVKIENPYEKKTFEEFPIVWKHMDCSFHLFQQIIVVPNHFFNHIRTNPQRFKLCMQGWFFFSLFHNNNTNYPFCKSFVDALWSKCILIFCCLWLNFLNASLCCFPNSWIDHIFFVERKLFQHLLCSQHKSKHLIINELAFLLLFHIPMYMVIIKCCPLV
jgi:hypothetical protein